MYSCIIFDVDGTILDTEQAILKSLQKIIKEEQQKHYLLDELKFALGIPGKETLRRLQIKDVDRVHPKWCQAVLEFSNEVSIFEGLKEVIHCLHQNNIKIGILTSKTKQELVDEFEPFGLSSFFSHTTCADDTEKHKPHPEPLLTCLENLEVTSKGAIYIGDSIYDMQCAKQAEVSFGLALWGSKTTEGFEADYILKEPQDILKLIQR
ncbi:HAD family hydrolase [Priestia megaterium]